jgi:type IV pilus assembly protein PilA
LVSRIFGFQTSRIDVRPIREYVSRNLWTGTGLEIPGLQEARILTCSKCGATLADNSRFCTICGNSILEPQAAAPPVAVPPPAPAPVVPEETSGKAVASLICGIINIFPLCVVAIILGHISLSQISKSAGRLKGRGLAIAGLVMGYLGLVAIPFILIVAAIAIPNLLRAKISANEASAVGNVRNIVSAEVSYATLHPQTGFTCNLSDLSSAGLIDSSLAGGQKYGYIFALQNCTAEKEGDPASHFQITASPVKYNSTGVRAFCADESGVMRSDNTGSAQCVDHGSPLE